MKLKKCCILSVIAVMLLCLASCGLVGGKTTYQWYDADGTLLFEETISNKQTPTEYELPSDNEKWNYVEWREGDDPSQFIAYRIPNNSYFVGNVFQIVVKDLNEDPIGTGSAFVFNDDGWFITNAHVMEDAYYAEAIFNIPNILTGESFMHFDINEGSYYNLDRDIYIGKIENYSRIQSFYQEIPINLTYELREKTYSVGYPLSSVELVINEGEVTESWSDLYEKLYSGNSYICSDSYIAPGSSGGILTNGDLEVIGITTLAWSDDFDEFISGASISSFNFETLLDRTNTTSMVSLLDRFHSDEKVYIDYFNEAKASAASGGAERITFDDGEVVAYLYKWEGEGATEEGEAYLYSVYFTVAADGWLSYDSEYYWSNGDRRNNLFCGFYDHRDGLKNFSYEFLYEWGDGYYYTVKSDQINYSPTIALTLNRYTVDSNDAYTPTDENIEYAKEQFNAIYEWLSEDLARFQ